MIKIIKEIKMGEYRYTLGYFLSDGKVYPQINIYREEEHLGTGNLCIGTDEEFFNFRIIYSNTASIYAFGDTDTINGMFKKMRNVINIPQEVENEYNSIFILYKFNDFNEL